MFERDLSLYSLNHSTSMQTFTKSHNFSSGLCLILGTFLSIHYTNTINIITRIRLSGPIIKWLWMKKNSKLISDNWKHDDDFTVNFIIILCWKNFFGLVCTFHFCFTVALEITVATPIMKHSVNFLHWKLK